MKKIITALALLVFLLLLVGCGKDASSSDDKDYGEDTVQSEDGEGIKFEEELNDTEETTQDVVPESVECEYLSDFMGKTVADITDMFGTDYTVSDYNGGYFISYQNQPFAFFYRDPVETSLRSDVPAPTDVIFIVMSGGEGTLIFEGVEIGSTVSDMESYLNQSLDIYYDEMECEHYLLFVRDGSRYIVYVDENNVITSCEIWAMDT